VDAILKTQRGWRALEAELSGVLAERQVTPAFQPLVEIDSRRVAGYEALARGPRDSALESPAALFSVAREAGRLVELDHLCRDRALELVSEADLPGGTALFLNMEPDALGDSWFEGSDTPGGVHLFAEVTERALTARPAELLASLDRMRERGFGIALDDVGADIRSLSLMPLLSPDVIKLDLRLVQEQPNSEVAAIVNAVRAERERSGAIILAEGVESEDHLETARALGATYAQGWLLGRPAALPERPAPGVPAPPRRRSESPTAAQTPYEAVAPGREVRRASKRLLLSLSIHLERQLERVGPGAIILSAFQDAERFTPQTVRRYRRLSELSAFVVALGVGMPAQPVQGVRGASLGADDPLRGEWSVVVLGPHFAAALVAVDLGDDGPDMERRFDYALTYDRDAVIEAAHVLARRVEPVV
jgi:EAL domain-containing protein (putative c-di-GMP-specific phosphodiesterase class I)